MVTTKPFFNPCVDGPGDGFLDAEVMDFRAAIENGDLDELRHWPKSDLHNHGGGSGDRAFLRERARRDGVTRLETGEDVWASTLFGGSAEELTRALEELHSRVAPRIELLVYAATSTRDALLAIEPVYEKEHAVDLVFDFGTCTMTLEWLPSRRSISTDVISPNGKSGISGGATSLSATSSITSPGWMPARCAAPPG